MTLPYEANQAHHLSIFGGKKKAQTELFLAPRQMVMRANDDWVESKRVSEIMGLYAVVVDALNEQAKSFYLKYGFSELTDDQLHLYLSIKTVTQLKL